jgi:hypothetical protein
VHFGDLPTTKKEDTKKPRLQASDIPARLPWNKNIPRIAADFIKPLFVCIHTGDPRYRYDASVGKVQKDEHQRIMTGRPYRRRYPLLKQVDTAEKKGVTIYGNCWKCNPNAPAHSTALQATARTAQPRANRRVSSVAGTSMPTSLATISLTQM